MPLHEMNDALKTNWIRGFANGEDARWRKVIASKYVADSLGLSLIHI